MPLNTMHTQTHAMMFT